MRKFIILIIGLFVVTNLFAIPNHKEDNTDSLAIYVTEYRNYISLSVSKELGKRYNVSYTKKIGNKIGYLREVGLTELTAHPYYAVYVFYETTELFEKEIEEALGKKYLRPNTHYKAIIPNDFWHCYINANKGEIYQFSRSYKDVYDGYTHNRGFEYTIYFNLDLAEKEHNQIIKDAKKQHKDKVKSIASYL